MCAKDLLKQSGLVILVDCRATSKDFTTRLFGLLNGSKEFGECQLCDGTIVGRKQHSFVRSVEVIDVDTRQSDRELHLLGLAIYTSQALCGQTKWCIAFPALYERVVKGINCDNDCFFVRDNQVRLIIGDLRKSDQAALECNLQALGIYPIDLWHPLSWGTWGTPVMGPVTAKGICIHISCLLYTSPSPRD